jgi:uncharacterized protein
MMSFDDNNLLPPEEFGQTEEADGTRGAESGPLADTRPAGSAILAREFPQPPARFIPDDLRVPWGWLDLLLLAVLPLAATLILSVLIAMLFAASGVSPSQFQGSSADKNLGEILIQTVLFLLLLLYLFVTVRVRFSLPFWRTIGWRPMETRGLPRAVAYLGYIGGGFGLSLLVSTLADRFGTKAQVPMETFFEDRRAAVLLLLLAVFVAPVIEETIFRGYIYPVVARSFGLGAGVVITGTLFGLLHAPQLWGGWAQIGLLIIVGMVFTYARAVTKTVLASYLLHASYNSFLSLAFLIGTHGLRILRPGP